MLSKITPVNNFKNASKVLPVRKYNCLNEKKPERPTPPKVICTPIKIKIAEIHDK